MSSSSSPATPWATFVADVVALRKSNSRARRQRRSQVRPLDELVTLLRAQFCHRNRSLTATNQAISSVSKFLQRNPLINACPGSACLLATPVAEVLLFLRQQTNATGCITIWLSQLEEAWQAYRTRLRRNREVNAHWFHNRDEFEPDPEPGTQLYAEKGPSYARRVFNTVRVGTMDTDAMWQTAQLEQCDLPPALLQFQTACQTSHNQREVVVQADTPRDLHNDERERQRAQEEVETSLDAAHHHLVTEEARMREEWHRARLAYAHRVEEAKACEPFSNEKLRLAYIEPCVKQLGVLERDPFTWEAKLNDYAHKWQVSMIGFIKAVRQCLLDPGRSAATVQSDVTKVKTDYRLWPEIQMAHAFVLPADTSPDVAQRLRAVYRWLCTEAIYRLLQLHIQPQVSGALMRAATAPETFIHHLIALRDTCGSWMAALETQRAEPREHIEYENQLRQAYEEELHNEQIKLWKQCMDVHESNTNEMNQPSVKTNLIRRILDNADYQYASVSHTWTRDSLFRQFVSQGRLGVGLAQTPLIPGREETVRDVIEGFTGDLDLCQQHWRVWVQACESERPTPPVFTLSSFYLDWYVDEHAWRTYQPFVEQQYRQAWSNASTDPLDRVLLASLEKRITARGTTPTLLALAETHFQLLQLELKSPLV